MERVFNCREMNKAQSDRGTEKKANKLCAYLKT